VIEEMVLILSFSYF